MQTQFVGNFAQHQRAHGQFAMDKKALLPLDDGGADAQDGVKPLLDIFNEPTCFLQPLLQRRASLALVLAQRVGVNVVHPQPRHDLAVQRDLEATTGLDDQHIGHHHIALDVDKAPAWLRVQPTNDADGELDHGFRKTAQIHQPFDVAFGQQLHRLLAHQRRRAGCFAVLAVEQLQAQALGQVARAHPGGLHVVQQFEYHRKMLHQLVLLLKIVTGQAGCQFGDRVFQVAVVIERLD